MARLKNKRTGVTINVSDETAARLDSEWGPYDAKPKADSKPKGASTTPAATGTPDSSWTVPALKAYAAENGIELAGATKKDDILAVIAAGQGTGAPDTGSDGDEDGENDDESGDDEDSSADADDESDS